MNLPDLIAARDQLETNMNALRPLLFRRWFPPQREYDQLMRDYIALGTLIELAQLSRSAKALADKPNTTIPDSVKLDPQALGALAGLQNAIANLNSRVVAESSCITSLQQVVTSLGNIVRINNEAIEKLYEQLVSLPSPSASDIRGLTKAITNLATATLSSLPLRRSKEPPKKKTSIVKRVVSRLRGRKKPIEKKKSSKKTPWTFVGKRKKKDW